MTPKQAIDKMIEGKTVSEVADLLLEDGLEEVHKGGGKGLFRRFYLTKKGKESGEGKGDLYWHKRNKFGKTVASVVATELIPGGTAINLARLGHHIAKSVKKKKFVHTTGSVTHLKPHSAA